MSALDDSSAPVRSYCFSGAAGKAYADAADWTSRVATGWIRTHGRDPIRLHESADRVHLVGGSTRLDANDEPILWNRVTYILTRPGSSWGIQARFSLGAYDGREDEAATSVASDAATGVVRRYYGALATGDGNTSAELCRYPLIDVGVGERPTEYRGLTVRAAQAGPEGVLVEVLADHANGGAERTVLVVGRWSGACRIAGISRILNP